MAAILKSVAATAVNKGPPSSFYTGDKPNPVFQSLEKEINLYTAYMKKRTAPDYKKPVDESSSRPADTVFELWNKYEPRLPKIYYQKKLLEMGDFLVSIQEYHLALWQCYGRYIKHFGDVNVEEITEVSDFKSTFFPTGFDNEDAGFTFRALMGKSICTYQVIRSTDPKLQNQESVSSCLQLLAFLRLVTQVILPKEKLCWLVYNGTVHMYSISRHLMSLGHSAKVLEFLLWACMCMESSVPLMATRHLTWRATLYTSVCQCYYDCKAGHHAEAFARRALSKVNELSQLESMSNAPESRETEAAFRQATVKMAIMMYKRTVFETRRKPKGLLRPKTRANLKDAAQLPWPRTASEKLLSEMFEGSAGQMLCLIETLNDSNRRTLISAPPAGDSEVEMLDVYAELFMAAQEIIAGGGGSQGNAPPAQPADIKVPGMGGVVKDLSLIQLATRGEDGVPLSTVVRLVKLAYCYEQWDVFDAMIDNTISAIKEVNDPTFGPDEKALEVLKCYDKVTPRTHRRKLFANDDESEMNPDPGPALPQPPKEPKSTATEDDLIYLAEVLLAIITGPHAQSELDMDMIVDACLALWNKCKAVFQKYQTGSTDNPRYLQRMDNPSKWVYILDIVHQVLGWCGLASVDPALTAEVALRLALVFEASAALDEGKSGKSAKSTKMEESLPRSKELHDDESVLSASMKDGQSSHRGSIVSEALPELPTVGGGSQSLANSRNTVFSTPMLNQGPREQLLQAREILELGLRNVSFARQVVARANGKAIADIGWVKELHPDLFKPGGGDEEDAVEPSSGEEGSSLELDSEGEATAVWNMVKDLHLELIFIYHRICYKLSKIGMAVKPKKTNSSFKRKTCSNLQYASSHDLATSYIETVDELVENCGRNGLSKALLFMQRALTTENSRNTLLEKAKQSIVQVQAEEKQLYLDNAEWSEEPKVSKTPPAPLLLSRTDTTAVFMPAPYIPAGGEKVSWYRLFARTAAGSNVKVRLNDYFLPGTGEEVPSFRCELRVSGLTPGEKYVFAVAAYTAEGKLIGDAIGETTRPILASHPLPVLLTWAYLCQVGYQVGHYAVAKEACMVLWQHFVAEPPLPQNITYSTTEQRDFQLSLHKLNRPVVRQASPVLLRMFLTSIFIHVDINVKDGALFCDTLCDQGPLNRNQLRRLHQCEMMLVALELAGWLNEANLSLQAVVQCYGLLAPMIHFKIPSVPVVQVLERCHAILQEIPSHLRTRRTQTISESLHHMTACLTYHLAKVLRTWGQRALASNINDSGRKLLAAELEREREVRLEQIKNVEKDKEKALAMATQQASQMGQHGAAGAGQGTTVGEEKDADTGTVAGDKTTETGSLTLAALKKKKGRVGGKGPGGKDDMDGTGNEELKALEAHMLRLSKQAQGEHELSGNEDPSILHAYIAYLPSKTAYKEVVKFKRRARYLEFFVQVAQKAVAEGLAEQALDWCEDAVTWLAKRNEGIIGSKAIITKQPGVVTMVGDDPKKFAAAMVEYTQAGKIMDTINNMSAKTKKKKVPTATLR